MSVGSRRGAAWKEYLCISFIPARDSSGENNVFATFTFYQEILPITLTELLSVSRILLHLSSEQVVLVYLYSLEQQHGYLPSALLC